MNIRIKIDHLDKGTEEQTCQVKSVYVVGYGGRDQEKVQEHIHELAEIGVAPPPTVPTIYPHPVTALTFEEVITVTGKQTSGEAEYVLMHNGTEWLVTVGSDHTDRHLEKEDIQKSKETCPKPLSNTFWRLQDVEQHWDQLILRCWVTDAAGRRLYQDHNLTALLPVKDLLEKLAGFGYHDLADTVIFSGTVPTLEGFVYGDKFEMELYDPILLRSLSSSYSVVIQEG
ncbi:DUF2848 family protein [Brevibacillus massiliensis]|uniref:DUF2848 family protein n=1 Tax=Brevibacillus massiliensis TaxID=1118054 RepID=UPI00035EA3B9|nr:DUF2848 family protein [Brevibacillus massiliensis]